MWISPELASKECKSLESLRLATDPSAEHTGILDQLKQVSLYTDCLGDKHWSEPDDVIDSDLAKSIVAIAKLLAKGDEIEVTEIELWIEHVRPSYGRPLPEMKDTLKQWWQAMHVHGLKVNELDSFEQFVDGAP